MEYKFSDKIAALKPSAVREILKSTADPEVIALAAGNPAPEAFPVDDVKRIAAEVMENETILALQYGVTEGYTPLIESLKAMLQKRLGLGKEFDEIIVTSGATQVMELLTKVLCNEGDSVAVEDPSFIGSLNAFRSYGVNLRGVPIDDDGINIAALEETLKADDKIRFLYTIPNFQNPSGCTMSLEKRRAVYDLACRYDIIVLEDNPYGDLRVEGEDLPCIKSFDTEGRVVYAGTFSKVISPGIRVGYALGPAPVLAKMTVGKQTEDVHNVMFSQLLVYHWLQECDFDAHVKKMQAIYRKKRDLMCGLIDSELGDYVTYVRPEGGLFVWCKLDDRLPMMEFCRKAVEKKVAVVPGTAFLADPEGTTQYIRLNYSTPTDEEIEAGVRLLGEVAREMTGE
ncbi:MAG: PLP-dependent aminotransferase family protein [Clostridia bacterium]|nr:PLP-dependent aminotransferase family protein [Clostridia bacterium]